jgi:hypothetical protein
MRTRRLLSLLALLVCATPAHGATSRHRYEAANASVNGGDGYKAYDNTNATLAWGESYIMMSYMALYRATGERLFLDRLADHADHVLATRDDLAGTTEYNGKSSPCWRNTKYQPNAEAYCYVVHSGMLTYPMADFAAAVLGDESLWEMTTYDGTTYKDKAEQILQRVKETVTYHDFQFKDGPGAGQGHYAFDPAATFLTFAGLEMPLNQETAMGRTLVMLHQATGDAAYLDKATRLAKRFKAQLKLQDGAYVWNYRAESYKAPGEDISHASINADFARLCHDYGIVFDQTDMVRFAQTVFAKIYLDSDTLYDHVGGSGSANGSSYKPQIGRWLHFAPYHPAIYTIVRNIYDGYDTTTGSGSVVLGFGLLAVYEPVARPHTFYYVDWTEGAEFNQAAKQNANILTVPPDSTQPVMVPITFASTVAVSVQQWDDVLYHEVSRWASTNGNWRTLWLPYLPAHWHPYWQGGALFQFTESPFAGIKVKLPEGLDPPTVATETLPDAWIGQPFNAQLTAAGPEPRVWQLVEAPLGMTIHWQDGTLHWDTVTGPAGPTVVTVDLSNDFGRDEVQYELMIVDPSTPDIEPEPDSLADFEVVGLDVPGDSGAPSHDITTLDAWEIFAPPEVVCDGSLEETESPSLADLYADGVALMDKPMSELQVVGDVTDKSPDALPSVGAAPEKPTGESVSSSGCSAGPRPSGNALWLLVLLACFLVRAKRSRALPQVAQERQSEPHRHCFATSFRTRADCPCVVRFAAISPRRKGGIGIHTIDKACAKSE